MLPIIFNSPLENSINSKSIHSCSFKYWLNLPKTSLISFSFITILLLRHRNMSICRCFSIIARILWF